MNTITEGIRRTARTAGWKITSDHCMEGVRIIRGSTVHKRFGKRCFAGLPLIEWRLSDPFGRETCLETRFGFDYRSRFRFWFILSFLAGLFLLHYYFGDNLADRAGALLSMAPADRFWLRGAAFCLAISFLLSCLVWACMGINSNLRNVQDLDRLLADLRQEHGDFSQDIRQNDYLFPDIFLVLTFFVFGASCIVIGESLGGNPAAFNWPDLWAIFLLIGILMALVLSSLVIRGFKERLHFILLALGLLLPVGIIYGLPYINLLFSAWLSFDTPEGPVGSSTNVIHWLVTIHGRYAARAAFYLGAANLTVLLLAFIVVANISNRIDPWILQRDTAFTAASRGSVYSRALDFNAFFTPFVVAITLLWLTMTCVLYPALFAASSIFEWGISGQNRLFISQAGRSLVDVFCLFGGVFLPPSRYDDRFVVVARVGAILYSGPLLGIVLAVVGRRLAVWWRKTLFLWRWVNPPSPDNVAALVRRCHRLAEENGIQRLQVIATTTPLPQLEVAYVGFPHFRPVLWIGQGCQGVSAEELDGLIAHEIFHLKYHVKRWYVLNLLSELTFFGTGFLAVLINSYANEQAADRFAVEWLQRKKIPPAAYVRALRIMAMVASTRGGAGGLSLGTAPVAGQMIPHGRVKNRWRLLLDLYSGDTIPSYIHPPLTQRIADIEAMEGDDLTTGGDR